MEVKDIITLIDAVSKADIMNFHMQKDGFSLSMDKLTERVYVKDEIASTVDAEQVTEAVAETEGLQVEVENKEDVIDDVNTTIIKCPIVGTYYNAPGPDQKAFVNEGDQVKKGQVLCIIEAMKLMNDIESDYDGTIVEILVTDGQTVEYGQPLFKIKTA